MNTLDLTPLHIQRPEKISWWFSEIDPHVPTWKYIRSKGLRKQLKNYQQIANENNINWEIRVLPESEFDEWILFYEEQMTTLHYDLLAKKSTFQNYLQDGWDVYTIDFFQDHKVIGRMLGTVKGDVFISRFKATKHIDNIAKHCSFGAFCDYVKINEFRLQKNIQHFSFGKSRNLFGVVNKTGYLEYKFQFGQIAKMIEEPILLSAAEVNEDGFAFFFGCKENHFSLYAIAPKIPNEKYEKVKKICTVPITELTI